LQLKKEFQSYGYGSKVIAKFVKEMKDYFLFLEIEDPSFHDPKISEKRISFYKKNGFVLNEHLNYVQPCYPLYQKNDSILPHLKIMSFPTEFKIEKIDLLKKLTKTVYSN